MCDHFRKLTKKYFVSHFLVRESLEKVIIGKGLGDFLSWIVPQFAKNRNPSLIFIIPSSRQKTCCREARP